MKKITFNHIDECIYKETLSNKVNVYYYKTDKTKNFYITISVKYGSSVKKYKINNKINTIIPGSAHFLEHKILNFTGRPSMLKKINELGLYANAYTSYDVTNYNLYGSKNIKESIKLLFDLFYNLKINDPSVKKEKGIISEENKMYQDSPNFRINMQVMKNVFNNSYMKDKVVGDLKQIEKINTQLLNRVYKDFYCTANTFVVVTGNFELEEVSKFINAYMKNIPYSERNSKVIYKKEPKKVATSYMEMSENITIPRVIYSLKIHKKHLNVTNKLLRRYYLNFIFTSLFSNTSKIYEKLKNDKLINNMAYSISDEADNYLLNVSMTSENPFELIKEFKKMLDKCNINEKTFERKKKMFLNNLVLGFENIEDVEFMITNQIIRFNKLINNSYNILEDMNYNDMIKIFKSIDFKNHSILLVTPKK